jgi:hypothetical protein
MPKGKNSEQKQTKRERMLMMMEEDGRFHPSLSSHYFWSNVRRKEHPFYLSFIPNRHTKEMLQHNGIAKCQIMFPSPSCAW